MSNNDVLIILSKHQKKWELITNKLLFSNSELKAGDVVQDMYLKVYDELSKNKLEINNIVINNEPHYGIIKNIIKRILIEKSRSSSGIIFYSIEELHSEYRHLLTVPALETETETEKDLDAKIDEVLNKMYWFDRKLFNLYRKEFHSIRSLSKATKISHVTVHKTISKCKKLLAKKVKF